MVCDDVVDEVAPELLDPTQQSVWADKSRLEIIEKRVADAALAKVTDYKFVGGVSFSTYVLSRTLTVKTTSMFMNKVGLPERYVAPRSLTKFIRSGKVRGAGVVGLLASGGLLLWDLAEPPEPEPLSPVEIRRAARLFSEGYRSAKQKCEGTLLKWLEKEPSQTLPTAPSTQE